MIEFRDITSLSGLLESLTTRLGVESFLICSSLLRNSSIGVSIGVEDIAVELDVE